jgi:hypothetical protein
VVNPTTRSNKPLNEPGRSHESLSTYGSWIGLRMRSTDSIVARLTLARSRTWGEAREVQRAAM